MKIYVMRHGQTVWNRIGKIQGWSANRLSELGKEQVKNASNILKNAKIDVIFSSPLMRTMQTANIMNEPHKVKIIKDDRLIEKDQGIFTGRFKDTLTEEEWELRKEHPHNFGGETMEDIYARTNEFLGFLKKEYKDKNVLVITHGHSVEFLSMILSGEDVSKKFASKEDHSKHAEVKMFEI